MDRNGWIEILNNNNNNNKNNNNNSTNNNDETDTHLDSKAAASDKSFEGSKETNEKKIRAGKREILKTAEKRYVARGNSSKHGLSY